MKSLLLILKWLIIPGLGAYLLLCMLMYFRQESFIFHPHKLPQNFRFSFEYEHEEVFIDTPDGERLHALKFAADSSKGLIFYLHGNAGALDGWGTIAGTYLSLGYDFFIMDYRGFGKSTGKIRSEEMFFDDVRLMFEHASAGYNPDNIVIIGYSIGAVPAALVASEYTVRKLILKAPFYSAAQLQRETFPLLPGFLLKYPLKTHYYLNETDVPVVIIHGDADEVIPLRHGQKLAREFKDGDTLIVLPFQTHNGMNHNPEFHDALRNIFNSL